jgi:hypothetical protein
MFAQTATASMRPSTSNLHSARGNPLLKQPATNDKRYSAVSQLEKPSPGRALMPSYRNEKENQTREVRSAKVDPLERKEEPVAKIEITSSSLFQVEKLIHSEKS